MEEIINETGLQWFIDLSSQGIYSTVSSDNGADPALPFFDRLFIAPVGPTRPLTSPNCIEIDGTTTHEPNPRVSEVANEFSDGILIEHGIGVCK